MWPSGVILYATILLIYYIGFCIQNATLASELIHKTQLESEQLAAQTHSEDPATNHDRRDPGLRSRRVLQAAARRGRRLLRCRRHAGQSHALRGGRRVRQGHGGARLAANIQAPVRLAWSTISAGHSGAGVADHAGIWYRYRPGNRFATAAFIVLDRELGSSWPTSTPATILRSYGVRGTTDLLEATA